MAKKRKLSGLSSLELQLAYSSLLNLKNTFLYEESDDADLDEVIREGFEQQIERTLSLMKSRLEGPQSLNFSSMTEDDLDRLKIFYGGPLSLVTDYSNRLVEATAMGQEKLWSSGNLHRHLALLEGHVSKATEACARAWIDALLFRAEAMLPSEKYMVLNMEHTIPHTAVNPSTLTTLSGFADYTAMVEDDKTLARIFLGTPVLQLLRTNAPLGFFVIEAKLSNPSAHVPQAVSQMYATGKQIGKRVIRGAVTNGIMWIFLHVKINDDDDGALYHRSEIIQLNSYMTHNNDVVITSWPDLVAAILSYWIENSSSDLTDDDWLGTVTRAKTRR